MDSEAHAVYMCCIDCRKVYGNDHRAGCSSRTPLGRVRNLSVVWSGDCGTDTVSVNRFVEYRDWMKKTHGQ